MGVLQKDVIYVLFGVFIGFTLRISVKYNYVKSRVIGKPIVMLKP